MESTALILWGLLFGSIGFGFFLYGKKQRAVTPLVVGIALFLLPYLIGNAYLLVLAGIVLITIPYFVRY